MESQLTVEKILEYHRQAYHKILPLPTESLKIAQDPKQNPMESTTILDKML